MPCSENMRLVQYISALILLASSQTAVAQDSLTPKLLWSSSSFSALQAFACSHDGKTLAFVNANELKLWDISSRRFTKSIKIGPENYDALAFTPDDRSITLLSHPGHPRGVLWCGNSPIPSPPVGSEFLINLESGLIVTVPSSNRTTGLWTISDDAKYVAIITDSGGLSVRETNSFRTLDTITLEQERYRYPESSVHFIGERLVVGWNEEVYIGNPLKLRKLHVIADSTLFWRGNVFSESIFVNRGVRNSIPQVFDRKGNVSSLQLPVLPDEFSNQRLKTSMAPEEALLFGDGKFLVTNFLINHARTSHRVDENASIDTIIVSDRDHPEGIWGLRINSGTKIMGLLRDGYTLLLNGPSCIDLLDLRSHEVTHISRAIENIIGFLDNGAIVTQSRNQLVAQNPYTGEYQWNVPISEGPLALSPDGSTIVQLSPYHGVRYFDDKGQSREVLQLTGGYPRLLGYLDNNTLLVRDQNKVASLKLRDNFERSLFDSLLNTYQSFIPYDRTSVIAYGSYGPLHDSAVLYDYAEHRIIAAYPGGLNNGISTAALSPDKKWFVTVAPWGGANWWRASDGALKQSFSLGGGRWSPTIVFSPNGRYLIYSRDSTIVTYDLMNGESKIALAGAEPGTIIMNCDGKTFALQNWHSGFSVYEVPTAWRSVQNELDPKQDLLPLRWYIPSSAREALDTNGKLFSPPRTDVEVEVRYSDGRLLKKLVSGSLHKGKWHGWNLDMSDYPKAKYILHTKLGGVVRDEPVELK